MAGPIILPVAYSVPFDNSTNGFISDNVQEAIEEIRNAAISAMAYSIIFTRKGSVHRNGYLFNGVVLTSDTGVLISGNAIIKSIAVSNSKDMKSCGTTFQLARRTGLKSFTDISGASVTIPRDSYYAMNPSLNISIGPNWEISCYNAGPNNAKDVILRVTILINIS